MAILTKTPTKQMLEEANLLANHRYYLEHIHPGSSALSNEWIDISYDTICALREANYKDAEAVEEMTRRTAAGERYGDFVLDAVVRFPMTTAATVNTIYGRTIGQGARGNLYRGEACQYESSVSTLDRCLRVMEPAQRERARLIAFLRIASFANMVAYFDTTIRWCESYDVDLLAEPLAQHYGFKTEMIDFTDDFDTALFFATCFWDRAGGCWKPLSKDMIAPGTPSEYGVIFHIPRWQAETVSFISEGVLHDDSFLMSPLGFQPFQRCHNQHGYGLKLLGPLSLQENDYFEKLRFKQSAELSAEVFDLMDGGAKVYPDEGLGRIEDILKQMREATEFSEYEFELGYRLAGGDERYGSLDAARALLLDGDGEAVSLEGEGLCKKLSRQRRRALDRAYRNLDLHTVSGGATYWHKPRGM